MANKENKNNKSIKKLTPAELKKQVKKLNEVGEAIIKIGESDYVITYDLHFKKTKQHMLLDDLVKFFNDSKNNSEIIELATPYMTLLVIKHFTSVEVSDDIEEALLLLETLIDLEILAEIVNVFPEGELTKIYELIAKLTTDITSTLGEMEDKSKELHEEVENDEVKKMIEEVMKEQEKSKDE